MEDLLTCSVCLRKYHDPRVLPCQHTFCLKPCLEKLFDVNFRQIKCPLCRVAHGFAKGYITSLPKNFTIRSIMDMAIDKNDKSCPLCNCLVNELSNCECCSKSICNTCHKIHFDKTKGHLQTVSNSLKKSLSFEKESFRRLLSDISLVENGKQKLILEINQSFNDINTALKQRKAEMVDAINKKFEPSINQLKSLEEIMEINVAVLSSSILSAADSLVNNNVSHGHLLALLNSIEKTLPDKSQVTQENALNLDIGEFSCDTENIKNAILNFGNLKWSSSEKTSSSSASSSSSPYSNIPERKEEGANEIITNVDGANCENTREKTYIIGRPCKSIAYEIPVSVNQSLPGTLQSIYMTKHLPILTFGTKGTSSGEFIWPRGIAVDNTTNRIIIADSSNHRIQIFSDKGIFEKVISELICDQGTDDSLQLKFDCLSGIAIDKNKRILCSDRYHHRVIIMDIDGRFICEIGKSSDNKAKLSYPWGIATDFHQNIFICDKDNHRIQVFSSDGDYIKEIGCHGQQSGTFDNPHYLAVCPKTKNIFVSDTSNHRIQVFDKHGAYLYSFSGDGPTKFHLKYPRGITIDNEGNVLICDYGNNRISIFTNQGKFLYFFGSHGSHSGQFKGLEGIAVFNDGRIAVSDRDNHRIQIF